MSPHGVDATRAQRDTRVRRLIEAARAVADPHRALGQRARQRLLDLGGLSAEGVELALREHLEIEPRDEDLAQLLDAYAPASRCHVVLSAHVCTAALRALACALAVAPQVCVKPSRRDPVLAELLIEALAADPAFAGDVQRVERVTPRLGEPVHAYGSDKTMAALRAALPDGVPLQAHGSGFGIALIGTGSMAAMQAHPAEGIGATNIAAIQAHQAEGTGATHMTVVQAHPAEGSGAFDIEAAARALAADVVPFDGRGCLTPRIALVESPTAAEPFAAALHRALGEAGARVPRGRLWPDEAAELARYRQLMEALGRYWHGPHHAVALDPLPESLSLGPAARVVLVVPASSGEQTERWLDPWTRYITCIGSYGHLPSPLQTRLITLCPGARVTPLGQMQKPPLDGPVDRRHHSHRGYEPLRSL